MTREQMIVFGFVVAAFFAGWIASFVTRRPRPARTLPTVEPITAARRDEVAPLADEVGQALRSDAANEGMMSVVRAERDDSLSELELDLADWGFTYGVAWARARERAPGGPDDDCRAAGPRRGRAGLPRLYGRRRLDSAGGREPLERQLYPSAQAIRSQPGVNL